MKGIITVLGKDKVGIIAKVCTYLAEHNLNILDISQTIVQDYFNMMMIVDISAPSKSFEEIVEELQQVGKTSVWKSSCSMRISSILCTGFNRRGEE